MSVTLDEPVTPTPDYVISNADPEAPYGRFANGKPRKTPPKGTPSPGKKRASTGKSSSPDYTDALTGFAQIGAFAVSFFSPVQAYAIEMHSPAIVTEVNKAAQHDMRLAAILDKMAKTGPYGTAILATIPLVVQMLHNAGRLPAQTCVAMGGKSRAAIEAELDARARSMMGEYDGQVPTS